MAVFTNHYGLSPPLGAPAATETLERDTRFAPRSAIRQEAQLLDEKSNALVVAMPAPDLGGEPEVVDPLDAFDDRKVVTPRCAGRHETFTVSTW